MKHFKLTIFSVFLTLVTSCTTTSSKQKTLKTDTDKTFTGTPQTTQTSFDEETRQMCVIILETNKKAAKKNQPALCKVTSMLISILNYALSEDEEPEKKARIICKNEQFLCLLQKIEAIDTQKECKNTSNWRTPNCDISMMQLQSCLSTFHQVRTKDITKFADQLPECKELTKEFFETHDGKKTNSNIVVPQECSNIIKKCPVLSKKIGLDSL